MQQKIYILNIETSSTVCSVSVAQNGETIYLKEEDAGFTHAENLHLFIENVIKKLGLTLKELSAIAIGMGPGSYTGLRIGMSAVKGLCYALEKPLIGISTLQLMSKQLKAEKKFEENVIFCPLVDARRMEVYFSVFDWHLNVLEKTSSKIISLETNFEWEKYERKIFFGSGVEKSKEILSELQNSIFIPNIVPSAKWMEGISYEKFLKKDFESIAYTEPDYGKAFYTGS